MESKLTKERLYFRCPTPQLLMAGEIEGAVSEEALRAAIQCAVSRHALLGYRVLRRDKDVVFTDREAAPAPEIVWEAQPFSWGAAVSAEEKRMFHAENGELIRFRVYPGENGPTLLCSATQLVCEAESLIWLFRDIMTALAAPDADPGTAPLQLYDPASVTRRVRLPLATKMMLLTLNGQWKRSERQFDDEEYAALFEKYWENRGTGVAECRFDADETAALQSWCGEQGIALGSCIAAAFALAAEESGVGLAFSVREDTYEGMGNFATGVSTDFFPSADTGFAERARELHGHFRRKLGDPRSRCFLLAVMDRMTPSLLDASYFVAFSGFQNPAAAQAAAMFGLRGSGRGVNVNCVDTVSIPAEYGGFRLRSLSVVPPLVPGCQRLAGAVIQDGCLNLTMRYDIGRAEEMQNCFDKAEATLRRQTA